MLLVTQDTEQAFLKELDFCKNGGESWRCSVFRCSQAAFLPDDWFRELTQKIYACFGDQDGKIFLFDNKNVFVLTKYATNKNITYLQDRLPNSFKPSKLEGLIDLFEINIDYQKIIEIVKPPSKDNATLIAAKSQIITESQEKKFNDDLDVMVDPYFQNLVATISLRRRKRDNPLILVIEDDFLSQRMVCNILNKSYSTLTAQTGKSALQLYALHAPDMVFLDIGLPDISGHEVLQKILKIDLEAYIVMLSGNADKDNILKSVHVGAKGFVVKPFTQDKLHQYISRCDFINKKIKTGVINGH